MATSAQIRQTAAENLGIRGEGETMPSYEVADFDQAITEVYGMLRQLNLVTWASTAAIPDEYAHSFSMMVASARALKYQIPEERYKRIQYEADKAIVRIRLLQTKQKLGQTQIENF